MRKGSAVMVYKGRALKGRALRQIKASGLWLVSTDKGVTAVPEDHMVLVENLERVLSKWGFKFDDVKNDIVAEPDNDVNTILAEDGCILYANGAVRWGIVY